jgi:hypothetical protein
MQLSDLISANPQFRSFKELERLVARKGAEGERFLEFDVKPGYPDTPRVWELTLESAFYWGIKPEPDAGQDQGADGDGGGSDEEEQSGPRGFEESLVSGK